MASKKQKANNDKPKPTIQYEPVPSNDSEYMQDLQRKFEENLKKMK